MEIASVPITSLSPHPRNYRVHPDQQLEHLQASLQEFGWARNVVVSSDNVILAGHGIVEAARRRGETEVPVHRLNLPSTDPKAEKFMVLENEVSRLAEDDETQLAALLADIQRTEGLDGTGWDDGALDALIGEMAKQQPYSPNLQPELADKQYTDGDIDKEQQRLAGQYQKEKDLDEITCPHCGGEFFIDK